MAKKFFYVSAGLLMIAIAYHLGASTATAQAPSNPVVGIAEAPYTIVVTANGDVYHGTDSEGGGPWTRVSNVFGAATATAPQSFGALKAKYR